MGFMHFWDLTIDVVSRFFKVIKLFAALICKWTK
jgi:hypothetical protein